MVGVNNQIGQVGNNINIPQNVIKTSGNKNKEETGNKFSSLLDSKQTQQIQKTPQQQNKIEPALQKPGNYSPLMLRYGVNKINEIKNIAESYGVKDLSNEDFDYAIRYGRSLLADYSV